MESALARVSRMQWGCFDLEVVIGAVERLLVAGCLELPQVHLAEPHTQAKRQHTLEAVLAHVTGAAHEQRKLSRDRGGWGAFSPLSGTHLVA